MAGKSPFIILAGLLGVGAVGGGMLAFWERAPITPPPVSRSAETTSMTTNQPPITPARHTTAAPAPTDDRPHSTPRPTAPPATAAPFARRTVEKCRILMAIVNDPNPPLNVRSQPNVDSGKVIGTLADGTYVSVKQESSGWFEITEPTGWIAKSKTVSRCGDKVERVEFAPNSTGATISDEFLGTGSHRYQLQLRNTQTLTVTAAVGPTPALIAPNGQYLIGMDERPAQWSTQLAQSGTYTIEFDSNFRGYKYEFTITANS
jgi:Bacterial SH3 domain